MNVLDRDHSSIASIHSNEHMTKEVETIFNTNLDMDTTGIQPQNEKDNCRLYI